MNDEKYILAVDIGASKVKLGVFPASGLSLTPVKEETLVSKDFPAAAEMISSFLDLCSFKIDLACIGVPGPVIDAHQGFSPCPTTALDAILVTFNGHAQTDKSIQFVVQPLTCHLLVQAAFGRWRTLYGAGCF